MPRDIEIMPRLRIAEAPLSWASTLPRGVLWRVGVPRRRGQMPVCAMGAPLGRVGGLGDFQKLGLALLEGKREADAASIAGSLMHRLRLADECRLADG